MNDEAAQLKIRLPEPLKKLLAKKAKQNNRSMNAEIISCLEKNLSFSQGEITSVSNCLDSLIENVQKRALSMVDRELALVNLDDAEKKLLLAMGKLPNSKKVAVLNLFTSLIETL